MSSDHQPPRPAPLTADEIDRQAPPGMISTDAAEASLHALLADVRVVTSKLLGDRRLSPLAQVEVLAIVDELNLSAETIVRRFLAQHDGKIEQ